MNSEVLIIGGSGFIASNLIKKFLEKNFKVIVYGRSSPIITHENIVFIRGELREIREKLFHLQSKSIINAIYLVNNIPVNYNIDEYDDLLGENKIAINFLSLLVRRVVFFSSGGRIYKGNNVAHLESDTLNATCAYGKSKIELELYLSNLSQSLNKEYLIIRPSNPYGQYQNIDGNQGLVAVLIGKFLNKSPIEIWGTGNEVRDYIFIDDFVGIFYKLLMKRKLNYSVYNISSGIGVSSLNVLKMISIIFENKNFPDYELISPSQKLIEFSVLNNERVLAEVNGFHFTKLKCGFETFINEEKILKGD